MRNQRPISVAKTLMYLKSCLARPAAARGVVSALRHVPLRRGSRYGAAPPQILRRGRHENSRHHAVPGRQPPGADGTTTGKASSRSLRTLDRVMDLAEDRFRFVQD